MKTFLLIIATLLCISYTNAQTDPKSKNILEKAAETNNSYKTITSKFIFTSTEIQTNKITTEQGEISIKDQKYNLKIGNNMIIFDGKSIFNYSSKSNEVNITYPEPAKTENGDFFISNPRDIFKFYTKNFKSKWIKETIINNVTYNEIELYPVDLKTKYTKITMHIHKTTFQILDFKVYFKVGTRQSVEFKDFKPNNTIPDSEFVFDTNKYPDITINDLRF